jgi:hypothetical protein
LLAAILALEPRAGVHGDSVAELGRPDSKYWQVLGRLDRRSQYLSFLVRDDSFNAFRRARLLADRTGFDVNWELLGRDEPIKIGTGEEKTH